METAAAAKRKEKNMKEKIKIKPNPTRITTRRCNYPKTTAHL